VDSIFEGRSPLKQDEGGWEPAAVRSNFHTLAYTYGWLDTLRSRTASRLASRALDGLVLSTRLPSVARRRVFEAVTRWSAGRFQPEWIKY